MTKRTQLIEAINLAYIEGRWSDDPRQFSKRPDGTYQIVPCVEDNDVYYITLSFNPGDQDIHLMTGVRVVTEDCIGEVLIYGHKILKEYFN